MAEHNNTPSDLAKRGALAAFGLVAAAGAAVIGNRKANAQAIIPNNTNNIIQFQIAAQSISLNGSIIIGTINSLISGVLYVNANVTVGGSSGLMKAIINVQLGPGSQYNLIGAVQSIPFNGASLIAPLSISSTNIIMNTSGAAITVTSGITQLYGVSI